MIRTVEIVVIVIAIVFVVFIMVGPAEFVNGPKSPRQLVYFNTRILAVALERYHVEHGKYPEPVDPNGVLARRRVISGGSLSFGYVPWRLTTPVAYVDPQLWAEIVSDPYSTEALPYRYVTDQEHWWFLISNGPDHDVDTVVVALRLFGIATDNANDIGKRLTNDNAIIRYDTSNGTESNGDMFRFGPH